MKLFIACLAVVLPLANSFHVEATLVVGDTTTITAGTFTVSNTDLLQTNLSSATGEADSGARNGNFPASASVNENNAANPANVWALGSTVTYIFDSKWSIGEINAYTQWDQFRAEQGYTLEVTRNGGTTWSTIGVVSTPDIVSGNAATRTSTFDDAGGPIATGVNGIRFANLTTADGGFGDVYREFDVIKSNLQVGQAQINPGNVLPSPFTAVSGDLLETSVASVTGENATAQVRNGFTGTAGQNSGTGPASVWGQTTTTYNFDLSVNTLGYDITDINVFSGWQDNRSDQSYRLLYSLVGDASFIQLGDDIIAGINGAASVLTRTFNLDGTAFLTGVDAIRFVQFDGPAGNDGTGTVYREFDVLGTATRSIQTTIPEPATVSLALLGLGGLMMRRRRMA